VNQRSFGRVASPYLGLAGIATAASSIVYVRLLGQQGDLPGVDGRQAFVLALLIGLTWTAAVGAFARSATVRAAAAAASAAALLPLGFLALFSIGVPLLLAGGLAVMAWIGAAKRIGRQALIPSAVGAGAALTILAVGLLATG
jgi:hypothetical protein